jgi:protein TonB
MSLRAPPTPAREAIALGWMRPDQGRKMVTRAIPAQPDEETVQTANDRFKQSYRALFFFSLILATLAHYAVLDFWPEMVAEDVSFSTSELQAIELPPTVEIPEAPQAVARPATPIIAPGNIDEEITIAPTTFKDNPVSELPPPPTLQDMQHDRALEEAPAFTPFTVKPDIRNREEVQRALQREYPPLLRDAGIGGTVLVWFFIDEDGHVVRTLVQEGSGYEGLDNAALKVAGIIQFTPALNRDKRVPVWISLPVTFTLER